MRPALKNKVLRIVLIPVALFIVLIPVSTLLGWSLLTGVLYWFIAVPLLSVLLPKMIRINQSHLYESLLGVTLFYAFMVFMIYKHFTSDFFVVMMISFVFNLVSITIVETLIRKKMFVNP